MKTPSLDENGDYRFCNKPAKFWYSFAWFRFEGASEIPPLPLCGNHARRDVREKAAITERFWSITEEEHKKEEKDA